MPGVVDEARDDPPRRATQPADAPFLQFVEKMRDGAATVSERGVVLYANARLAQLLSRPKETIVGAALATFIAGDRPEGWPGHVGDGGRSASVELDLVDADGLHIPVLAGTSPLGDDADQVAVACVTFTDLTAQKAHEAEIVRLNQAEAAHGLRFTAVVEALQEGVVVQDGTGRVLEANRTASQILGIPPDELVTDPPTRLNWTRKTSMAEAEETPGRRALAQGHAQLGIMVAVERDDRRVWLEINSVPLRLPGDVEIPVVISSFRDVTARVAADEAIRFQALLLDTAGQAIVAVDDHGLILYWNKHATQMYGWTAEEAVGQYVADLILPTQTAVLGQEMVAASVEGETWSSEYTVKGRDGVAFPVFATSTPVFDDDGTLVAMITVATDISDRKLAERMAEEGREELLAAQHEAELEGLAREEANRANQAKSEFLSRMSHELRTPLNAVLGFGQILSMDDLTPDQRESVDLIRSAGEHLLGLINDVLDVSRIEAGALRLSLAPVVLSEVMANALSLIAPQAAKHDISIPTEIGEFEGVSVHSDRQRLLQVLLNLLSTAVKYNRPGGRIEVGCESSGGTVVIAVSDTGMGMDEADLAKLFTPFERLGAESTTVEGTGVGLALSRVLSQQMGGSLTVSSTVGTGSTFSLELPVSDPSRPPVHSEPVPAPVAHRTASKVVTVLAIEDHVANVRLLEQAMKRCGHVNLLTAIQGRLGLEIAAEHRPDLILLDLHLPDMPGETVLERLRADAATASIPVVICSADASPRQSRDCLDRGAAAYLTKPLDLADLFALVEQARADEL